MICINIQALEGNFCIIHKTKKITNCKICMISKKFRCLRRSLNSLRRMNEI